MKNIKNFKFLSFLFVLGMIVTSCVQDDDFETPEVNAVEPNVTVNSSISTVKAMYGGFEPVLIEAGADSQTPVYIEAYVVSSDESGNFYKTLVIQDTPENPTAGVAISTDATDTYTFYEPGRKVYFRVDGLFIGEYAGLPTIGTQNIDEIGRIGVDDFESRILRSNEVAELVPTPITIEQAYNEARLNTLIQLQDVQFPNDLLGQAYGNLDNTFSVNRTVEDCDDNTIILRNSGFSDFKNLLLPEGNGTLTAVLSLFNNDFQLFIRNTNDVNLDGARCPSPMFEEDFEGIAVTGNGEYVDLPGWTNVNITGGTERYEARNFNGQNAYAQISAFNTGESPLEAWLVTPGIELMSSLSIATLNFSTVDGYNNGDVLKVYVSTDFSGDVETATWIELDANISTGHPSSYASTFTASGDVDLSTYIGQTVYIGYQYAGSSSGVTTTYEVDNVSVSVQ